MPTDRPQNTNSLWPKPNQVMQDGYSSALHLQEMSLWCILPPSKFNASRIKGEVQTNLVWLYFSCGSQACSPFCTPVNCFQLTAGWSPLSADFTEPGWEKIVTIWSGSAQEPGPAPGPGSQRSQPLPVPPPPQPRRWGKADSDDWQSTAFCSGSTENQVISSVWSFGSQP